MKVIFSIAAKLAGGGIGKTSYNQVLGIYRHGLLKKVICDSVSPNHEIDTRLVAKIHASFFEKLKIVPAKFQYALKDNLYDLLALPKIEETDIFHVWNGHGFYCLDKAKKLGAVTVVERASSHINTYERILKEEYKRWGINLSPVLPWAKKRLLAEYQKADFISTPSEFSYESMIQERVAEGKLVKLPYGVDTQIFTPFVGDKNIVEKLPSSVKTYLGEGFTSKPFTVVFAGQVGFRKGVVYLLEAWKKLDLSNAVLLVLGEVLSEFTDIVAKYKDVPTIKFAGFQPAVPFFQAADVFVFPSLEEGSALVTYEALSCGVPVVTTFESGSVVEDGMEGFLVKPRDVDSLADRLKLLYKDYDLRISMGQAARRKALEFSWQACGDRLVEWYKSLV